MLEIKLFGAGEAHYNHVPLPGFPNQQPHLLLSYLLLNRHHPVHRERLAAVLWGEYSTQTSRKYLRNALWRLRQALRAVGADADDFLFIRDESITLVSSGRWSLDVDRFEEALIPLQEVPGERLTVQQADELHQAATLYSGELLEGVYDEWCLYDRERLNALFVSALHKLMVFHGLKGAYQRGLAYGEQILAQDDVCESVHRQMMHLFWLLVDRNAALAQYKRCVQILREELDVAPMKRTTRLYQLMLHNQYEPDAWPDALSETGPQTQTQPLQTLDQQTLQLVQRLQSSLEETRAELRILKGLISNARLEG